LSRKFVLKRPVSSYAVQLTVLIVSRLMLQRKMLTLLPDFSETLVPMYQTKWCHIPEDCPLNIHGDEKSHLVM
jgi:hypothetical protein